MPMVWSTQMNDGASIRSQHVDALRGLAVLAMVQVHTAALLPAPVEITHVLAFVSAVIGGMAAPLFVTLSGWAVHRGLRRRFDAGQPIARWLWMRVLILFTLQFVVNLLLPQRFRWYSPGVLSLLALCTLISPLMLLRDQLFSSISVRLTSTRSRLLLAVGIGIAPTLFFLLSPSLVPAEHWWWFVQASSITDWLFRLFINGTYPFLPWAAYFLVGGILDHTPLVEGERGVVLRRSGGLAFATLALTGGIALVKGRRWAMTIGDGILTFFPANPWFVLVSLSWAVFVWDLFRACSNRLHLLIHLLAPSGRLSLSIYVFHFAILSGFTPFFPGELGIVSVFVITLSHVLLWMGLSIIHQAFIPNISLESLLRSLSVNTMSSNDPNNE
ncbi:MAG TPA: acyltransferase [Candidatus Poseidoniales archaeon]|nr:acyltransferase [Candidatus Poseidoniales archaeon]